jgi:hypothetical protein
MEKCIELEKERGKPNTVKYIYICYTHVQYIAVHGD